jgi:hypothetical protein
VLEGGADRRAQDSAAVGYCGGPRKRRLSGATTLSSARSATLHLQFPSP